MGRAGSVAAAARLLLLLLAVCSSIWGANGVQKGASLSVRARWQGTPYLLEAAEFLADEAPATFWRFLDGLQLGAANSSSRCWRGIVDQASALCLPQVAQILPLVLGVRQYSARLEMFRQLSKQLHPHAAEAHCCYVDVHGSVVTSAGALPAALKAAAAAGNAKDGSSSAAEVLEADHVFNPDAQDAAGAVTAVLYAAPGTACWEEWHAALKAAAQDASAPVVYVHRPVLSTACQAVHACASLGSEEQLVLPGYGVEAVLKNTEYSALDDKSKADAEAAKKAAASKSEGGADGGAELDVSELGEVKGFKFDVLAARKPGLVQELMTFRDALLTSDEEEAIKVWDIKDAGLQAASRVSAASNPLRLLSEISQNFPSLVSSLTNQKVSERLRQSVRGMQRMMHPGANFMMLNGMLLEVKNFELYSFLERLRIELRLQGQLQSLGLSPGMVQQLLVQRSLGAADSPQELRLDLAPMKQVLWLNNPEKDKAHAHLPRNLQALLQMFPGRLGPMAANAFNAVVIGDPLSPECVTLANILFMMSKRLLPTRLGMLPVVPDAIARADARRNNPGQTQEVPTWQAMSNSERFTRAFFTLKSAYGVRVAWDFWQKLSVPEHLAVLAKGEAAPIEGLIQARFSAMWGDAGRNARTAKGRVAAKKAPEQAWEDLVSGSGYSSEAGMQLADASSYLASKGLGHLPKPMWWLNGLLQPISDGGWAAIDQEVGYAMMLEMQQLQEQLYFGRIDPGEPVIESLMELLLSVRRWNPRVLGMDDDAGSDKLVLAEAVKHPAVSALPYLHASGTSSRLKPVTHWVVADLSSARSRGLAAAAASFVLDAEEELEPEASRMALLLAPAAGGGSALDVAVLSAQQALGDEAKLPKLVHSLLTQQAALADVPADGLTAQHISQLHELASAVGVEGAASKWTLSAQQVVDARTLLSSMSDFVKGQLQVAPGAAAVVTNGRLVWDHDPKAAASAPPLAAEDFALLQLYAEQFQLAELLGKATKTARAKALKAAGKVDAAAAGGDGAAGGADQDPLLDVRSASDVVMVTASALAAQVYPDSRFGSLQAKQIVEALGSLGGTSAVSTGPPQEGAELSLVAILNPLTREAQRMSQILLLLQDVLNPSVKLFLNPQLELSELPLKSFYRYALPEFTRGEDGRLGLPGAPSAYFSRLPLKRVLTLNLELPESWLVEPVMALHDLDNLRLADIPEQVAYAEYELEAIMLTGSCSELPPKGAAAGRLPPPKGLQLHLGTQASPHMVDTLVMQNLGYFQLKAAPGLWQLSIAPGRSRELYRLVGSAGGSSLSTRLHHFWGPSGGDGGASGGALATTDYSTQALLHSFTGKHLLLKVQKRPGKEAESLLPSPDDKAASTLRSLKKGDTINVFTVASGHMYERLQKIMILSVIKNTKSRVKFWIIKNYMSPHHRRIIPAMAAQYGFDYEFVTYKWPHWLHQQTDKQRIIWAYKILFLDVLFPVDVPRMIFVDSDQVVRTDLGELYHMDLKGAPLAYTPFCDNNAEMEPYRFWKTGFWQGHLGGRPYHISALYLIDLARFRQLAAGDQYRVTYDSLSKDPNSLANLDQDLPNYAQHSIPIFSLPQEWLWCESWCGNETKAKARTIDLCNNPKTKEPKLAAARRIIKEWPALDEEQAAFTASVDARFKEAEAAFAAAAADVSGGGGGGGDAGGDDGASGPDDGPGGGNAAPDHSEL